MDPLSISASILTIVATGKPIARFCKKIRALKDAPQILLTLNNEVADLHRVVQDVDNHLQRLSDTTHQDLPPSITGALTRTKATLLRFQSLIVYELETPTKNNITRLDRSAWLKAGDRIRIVQNDIRNDRDALTGALALLSSSTSLSTKVAVQQNTVIVQQISLDVADLQDASHSNTVAVQQFSHDVVVVKQTGTAILRSLESFQRSPKTLIQPQKQARRRPYRQHFPNRKQIVGYDVVQEGIPEQVDHNASSSGLSIPRGSEIPGNEYQSYDMVSAHGQEYSSGPSLIAQSERQSVTFNVARRSCDVHCKCTCHKKLRIRSPKILDDILGSLFVGYNASPWSVEKCDDTSCQQRARKLCYTYTFPKWFLNGIVHMTMAYATLRGPELLIRIMRVRSDAEQIALIIRHYRHHKTGLDTIKYMLMNGEASVLDVFPQNASILRYALQYAAYDVAEILIRAGADSLYEDSSGQSPYTTAWARLLHQSQISPEPRARLREICSMLGDSSQLELFGFPRLHKAYLGLAGESFEQAWSNTSRSAIDDLDYQGRTILSWACDRGDDKRADHFLRLGADPNKVDAEGRTPLHRAVQQSGGDNKCVEALLEAKADIDLKDSEGRTALWHSMTVPENLEKLLKAGADFEIQINSGMQPLHSAAIQNRDQSVAQLLRYGANINSRDLHGQTPLHASIIFNSHEVLELLLREGDLDTCATNSAGKNVLQYLADDGDIRSIKILKSAASRMTDPNALDCNCRIALIMAEWRRDCNSEWSKWSGKQPDEEPDEWYSEFRTLIDVIEAKHIIKVNEQARTSSQTDVQMREMSSSLGEDSSYNDRNEEEYESGESFEDALETQEVAATP